MTTRIVSPATCLGCGCSCDDIEVVVEGNRIVEARRACALGVAWFGDGAVPAEVLVDGRAATLEVAMDAALHLLGSARRPLVYLGAELSCEAQRAGVAVADRLGAMLDSVTSATALPSILASQRLGRAGATLGEVRNRADLLLFWGVDPAARYPRYPSRYAPEPAGLHVPGGRRDRTVIAVDIGEARGPADADARLALRAEEEEDALALLRAVASGRTLEELAAGGDGAGRGEATELARRCADVAGRLTRARYAVVVHDAEPAPAGSAGASAGRAEALIALAQTLNAPTRCALSRLRAGGNRSGADAVVTWQTGFPSAVDFARGAPRYRPREGAAALLARGEVDVALVLGDVASVPAAVAAGLGRARCVVVGPRASSAAPASTAGRGEFVAAVAIDTGVAGIHEGGIAFRMDDVPLPLRPSLTGPVAAADVARTLVERLRTRPAAEHPGGGRPDGEPRAGGAVAGVAARAS